MHLQQLLIRNFRNITEAIIPIEQGVHYFHGLNGQGKTSILESIHVLSNLRSFRDPHPQLCVQEGSEKSVIEGQFGFDQSNAKASLKVELVLGTGRFQKKAYVNGKLSRSSADFFGVKSRSAEVQFHAISLNPASTDLIRGEPTLRRNYLNLAVASENPSFLDTLKRYQKILDQKNALLKEPERYDQNLLSILNNALVKEGSEIILNRLKWVEKTAPKFEAFLAQIAPKQKPVFLGSKTFQMPIFPGHFDPMLGRNLGELIAEVFHQKLDENRTQERARMSSLVGPHRDDLVFRVGSAEPGQGSDLVDVGSQGEVRSVLLALKLAELESFESETGVKPVFLIDDFSSELDEVRREFLLGYLRGSRHQVFVTATDARLGEKLEKVFRVVQGKVFTDSHE